MAAATRLSLPSRAPTLVGSNSQVCCFCFCVRRVFLFAVSPVYQSDTAAGCLFVQASPRHFQHAPGHTVFRLAGACCFTGAPASEKNQAVLLCCSHAVFTAGLTLAGVRLSVVKGGSNKVLAAAQRGGLLFTHKVNWQSCWCASQCL